MTDRVHDLAVKLRMDRMPTELDALKRIENLLEQILLQIKKFPEPF